MRDEKEYIIINELDKSYSYHYNGYVFTSNIAEASVHSFKTCKSIIYTIYSSMSYTKRKLKIVNKNSYIRKLKLENLKKF